MLQVGAEALEFERGPDCELVHGVALGGPDGEAVRVESELILHAFDGGFIGVEEDLLKLVS